MASAQDMPKIYHEHRDSKRPTQLVKPFDSRYTARNQFSSSSCLLETIDLLGFDWKKMQAGGFVQSISSCEDARPSIHLAATWSLSDTSVTAVAGRISQCTFCEARETA